MIIFNLETCLTKIQQPNDITCTTKIELKKRTKRKNINICVPIIWVQVQLEKKI